MAAREGRTAWVAMAAAAAVPMVLSHIRFASVDVGAVGPYETDTSLWFICVVNCLRVNANMSRSASQTSIRGDQFTRNVVDTKYGTAKF